MSTASVGQTPRFWGVPGQELDLSGCQCLTDAGLISLARSCPGLRALNVSSCYELTDAAFQALGGACSGLASLNVCGCDRLTDAGLSALAVGARWEAVLVVGLFCQLNGLGEEPCGLSQCKACSLQWGCSQAAELCICVGC